MTTRFPAVALLLCAVAGAAAGQTQEVPRPEAPRLQGKDTLVYIGTSKPEGKGIRLFRLQSAGSEVFQNVTLVPWGMAIETPTPSWFEIDSKRRVLFAVNEVDEFEGKPGGSVSAFSIDGMGKLTLLNARASRGTRPCHLTLDTEARNILVTNCGSGSVAVLPIAADGQIAEATDVLKGVRAVGVSVDPQSRFAFVCEPGANRVLAYRFDAQAGKLTPAQPASIATKPGAGSRQMVFRPDGKVAYLLNEKLSTISVLAYDEATGAVTDVQTVSTVPEYFDGPNLATQFALHRTGKYFYVSNSGHNSIVLFNVDAANGTLTYVEEQGTGARNPRYFGMQPSGGHLAISNNDSDKVLASRIDDTNGRLKPSGIFAEAPAPASIRFLMPAGMDGTK